MTATSNVSLTSATVIGRATGHDMKPEELGGPEVHGRITGQVDQIAADDASTIHRLRTAFGYFPSNVFESLPSKHTGDPPHRICPDLRTIVPDNPMMAFDMRRIVQRVIDVDSFSEYLATFAQSVVAGLARMDGRPVIILASQSTQLAGSIDTNALIKMKRMFRLADSWGFPVISFLDTPGVLSTVREEHSRLLSHVSELAALRLRADVPKIAIIVRRAYGYALFAMNGGDREGHTFAWPSAQIAFTGPEPGAAVVYRAELAATMDPKRELAIRAQELRRLAEPYAAAAAGYVDDIIDPESTRKVINQALDASLNRRRRSREASL
jgi:acetyl-CoA carboxylase carboxyltransferase component